MNTMNLPVFPEIEMNYGRFPRGKKGTELGKIVDTKLRLFTLLRIQYGGKWYLNRHMQLFEKAKNITIQAWVSDSYKRFIRDVWNFHNLGMVDTDLKDSNGENIFELDDCQLSEKDRLYYMLKSNSFESNKEGN